MRRTATVLVTTIVAATTLSGCGGGSAYCDAVKKDQSSLNAFGKERTNAAYTNYAKVLAGIAKVSPADVKKDWTALANATSGIVAAQKTAGIPLEDMTDKTKLAKVSPAKQDKLNVAYKAFNGTTAQRTAVVKNVLQECDIKLK